MVRHPYYSDIDLLENHVQSTQHLVGTGGIIRHESDQTFAFFDIRLKSQNVYSTLRKGKEALAECARFVFDRYGKLLGLRHPSGLLFFQNWQTGAAILPAESHRRVRMGLALVRSPTTTNEHADSDQQARLPAVLVRQIAD